MNVVIICEQNHANGEAIEENVDEEGGFHDLACLNPLVVNDFLNRVLLVNGFVQVSKLEEKLGEVNVVEANVLAESHSNLLTND